MMLYKNKEFLREVDCVFVGYDNESYPVIEVVVYDEKMHHEIEATLSDKFTWLCHSDLPDAGNYVLNQYYADLVSESMI